MSRMRWRAQRPDNDHLWRVADDLVGAHFIDPAELDAMEAFLMPQLNAILSTDTNSGEKPPTALRPDSQAPHYPALEKAERR